MRRPTLMLLLLLCIARLAHAQGTDCTGISRDTDKVSHTITCISPEMNLILKKVISGTDTSYTLNCNVKQMAASEEMGLYIRLEDGHTLRYFGQKVSHTWLNARDGYNYETILNCNRTVVEALKSKKVVLFQIAGIDVTVNEAIAEEFQNYVQCMLQ